AGVREVGALFRREFDALGFKTEWIDGAAWNRAGHLVATHAGPGQKILLIGHLDTVFEKDSPFQKFEKVDATHAKGPGICDMKGGDVAIGFENGDGNPAHAVTARRGTTSWRLETTGVTGHSSQVFGADLGAGAIYEAARIVNSFRVRLAGQPHLTFNPGVFLGGTSVEFDGALSSGTAAGKTNVVAAKTVVSGDLRALTPGQFEKAMETMRAIVKTSLSKTT